MCSEHVTKRTEAGEPEQAASEETIIQDIQRYLERLNRTPVPENAGKSMALGGYARSGKSILARRIAERSDFVHMAGDEFRKFFWEIEDDDVRDKMRREAYTRAFKSRPRGLLVETDDFISVNRGKSCGFKPFGLDILVMLRDADLADVALVAPRDQSVESRLAALTSWRKTGKCWTLQTHTTEAAILQLAHRMVRDEEKLRNLAQENSIEIIEIDLLNFAESVDVLSANLIHKQEAL